MTLGNASAALICSSTRAGAGVGAVGVHGPAVALQKANRLRDRIWELIRLSCSVSEGRRWFHGYWRIGRDSVSLVEALDPLLLVN